MTKTQVRRSHHIGASEETEAKYSSTADAVKQQLKSIPKDTVDKFWESILGSTKDVQSQVFGGETAQSEGHSEGMLSEGQELSLQEESTKLTEATIEHKEYFREIQTSEKMRQGETENELRAMIDKILAEIQTIANVSAEMQQVAKETRKHQLPAKPGRYHINFFGWLLDVVRNARVRIEAGANWMQMFSSKKKQRSYLELSKKYGTQYSLNHEHNTSRSVG